MVLHNFEVALPRLLVPGQVGEGDHLGVEQQAGLYGLQHRRVLHADEAELAQQVPHEVLTATTRKLDVAEVVHGCEILDGSTT